jgi:hypothetical protein
MATQETQGLSHIGHSSRASSPSQIQIPTKEVESSFAIMKTPEDPESGRKLKPMSWFFVVFSLLAALFLFALDNTIVANIQADIIYALGEIDKLPWVSVAFALGAVGTNLFWYLDLLRNSLSL